MRRLIWNINPPTDFQWLDNIFYNIDPIDRIIDRLPQIDVDTEKNDLIQISLPYKIELLVI